MKKNLSYRDKLLELSEIYKIAEIQVYERNKKYLTTAQIEHILKKNKVPIPTELKKNIFEIQAKKISKPIFSTGNRIGNFFSSVSNSIYKFFASIKKSIINFFLDTNNSILNFFSYVTKTIVNIIFGTGRAILNFCSFVSKTTLKFFNGIYNFDIETKKVNQLVSVILISAFLFLFGVAGYFGKDTFINFYTETLQDKEIEKKTIKEKTVNKKLAEEKKNEPVTKPKQKQAKVQPKKQNNTNSVKEFVLPNLNLKTETVLSLFNDVQYDLRKVRNEKRVKPIYFTQFPKDLDEIKDSKLKKDTFIKIVLPLVVAENEKITDDRLKLKKIQSKKITSEKEKSWLRQKLREYKVKNSDINELKKRMDIIPISIALAQAAKESGWGTSRFALEGNAIFGQWTWTGQGIEPLDKGQHQGHKILKFPILRASVKAYQNNLNTHKSYNKFREKRSTLREKKRKIAGLELTETLNNYAQTGSEYTKKLNQIIRQNRLTDFEPVRLVNSVKKIELSS